MDIPCHINGDVLEVVVNRYHQEYEKRVAFYEQVLSYPRTQKGMKLLVLVSDDAGYIPSSNVKHFVDTVVRKAYHQFERIAVVVSTDVQYGIVRMGLVQAENHGLNAAVFRCINAARKWLAGE
jgi:hypothetical protein